MAKKKKKAVNKNIISKKGTNRKKRINKKKNIKKNNVTKKRTTTPSSTIKKEISSNKTTKKKTTSTKNNSLKKKKSTPNTKKTTTNKKTEEKVVKTKKKKLSNIKIIGITFLILVIVLIIFLVLLLVKDLNNNTNTVSIKKINFDEYLELYNKDTVEFIYLYHNSCVGCENYEINLSKIETDYGIKINKFDYSKLNESELNILKTSNSFLNNGIDSPTILAIRGKEDIDCIKGVKEYSALKNFIDSSLTPISGDSFIKIDVDEYLNVLNSNTKSFIFMCDSQINKCHDYSSIVEEVANKRKLKVNYLNIDNINRDEDWNKLNSSSKIFSNQWFVPVYLVVKDGKIIDYKMESLDEDNLIKFLKKNGL